MSAINKSLAIGPIILEHTAASTDEIAQAVDGAVRLFLHGVEAPRAGRIFRSATGGTRPA